MFNGGKHDALLCVIGRVSCCHSQALKSNNCSLPAFVLRNVVCFGAADESHALQRERDTFNTLFKNHMLSSSM